MLVYAASIFLSAFLLFQVQPLIAKFILPWFGGSAAVWSAALLFFQLLLLAGYLYAHCVIRYLKPRQQFWTHTSLLILSLATLPIVPSAIWKPSGGDDPTLRILLLLGATIGLPYGLLSATSPLLQAWYLRTHEGAIPYRLFALSNFGSMLALLSYPFVIEPRIALSRQAMFWSLGYSAFAIVCIFAAWQSRQGPVGTVSQVPGLRISDPPRLSDRALWIALSACASILLLAVSSHLTQNIAPIPLLWIAPLSLYLLSFILCFESDRIYNRAIFLPLLLAALYLLTTRDTLLQHNADVTTLIPWLCGALFVCCMVCHGELARRRPHPRYLTQFYLMVSIGGASGGLFVALAAPHFFNSYIELPVGIALCVALVTCVLWIDMPWPWLRAATTLLTVAFAGYLIRNQAIESRAYIISARNFYGVLRVRDDPPWKGIPAQRLLIHGTINHGSQLNIPGGDRIPTSYFGAGSGINRALRTLGDRGPIRIGVLGLGAGVTATLARAGDTLHYYEINPLVVDIAKSNFGFWNACPAHKRLYLGDGRLVLERMPDEHLDLLAVDAFSSDAVPMHLLTGEAWQVFIRHLNPDAILAFNITNRYLNLAPVIAEAAAANGFTGIVVDDAGEEQDYYQPSDWVLLSRSPTMLEHPNFIEKFTISKLQRKPGFRGWTDDYSNIVEILQ
ncbi:MAG TPA: fused MFS/spermidine synthase [Bryobacteraceae bacterium]|nr:fused MFS/spermidine synthase [Bryobacteraceae bacterium]